MANAGWFGEELQVSHSWENFFPNGAPSFPNRVSFQEEWVINCVLGEEIAVPVGSAPGAPGIDSTLKPRKNNFHMPD
jgi:hypothetical protein